MREFSLLIYKTEADIFKEEELIEEQVVRNFRITASDGKSYNVKHLAYDMRVMS